MSEKDLKAAVRTILATKRAGTATVSPDELLRFRSGRMEDEERERLLERAATSPEVARALLDARHFPEVEPIEERHRVSEDDVSRQWQRFQERLGVPPGTPQEERTPVSEAGPKLPSAGAPPSHHPKDGWLSHLFGSLRFAQSAAAVLLLLSLGLSWVLFTDLSGSPGPRLNLPIVELVPESEQGERTEGEPLRISADADGIFLVLALHGRYSYTTYQVEIWGAGEEPVWSSTELRRSFEGIFTLELPRGFLPAGRYRITLRGVDGERRENLATYRLAIEYRFGPAA